MSALTGLEAVIAAASDTLVEWASNDCVVCVFEDGDDGFGTFARAGEQRWLTTVPVVAGTLLGTATLSSSCDELPDAAIIAGLRRRLWGVGARAAGRAFENVASGRCFLVLARRRRGSASGSLALALDLVSLDPRDRSRALPCQLHSLVATAILVERGLMESRGVELTLNVPAALPLVASDGKILSRVVSRMVDSAVRATACGGCVSISAATRSRFVEVTVHDTGSGIEPEERARIFAQAIRLGRSAEPPRGLCLSTAKRWIEAHGGEMTMVTARGYGTAVTLSLLSAAPLRARSETNAARA